MDRGEHQAALGARERHDRGGVKFDLRGCIVVGVIFPRCEAAKARTIYQLGNHAVRFTQIRFDAIDVFLFRKVS